MPQPHPSIPYRDYTTTINGGTVCVFVKDGKIIRTIPFDLAESDASSWTIFARGRAFYAAA